VRVTLERATEDDAAAIAALRVAVSRQLTVQFGQGTWSFAMDTAGGVQLEVQSAEIFVAHGEGGLLATLRLSRRNPWLGDINFFTPAVRPLYLTSMAVAPAYQRRGIGRQCLDDARRLGRELEADALRLDSYDAPAGAGDFYRKCGFREGRRDSYHGTPLIWFETMLPPEHLRRR
jgi:ribosomal protein S18 acetylase RimI-like enzyme